MTIGEEIIYVLGVILTTLLTDRALLPQVDTLALGEGILFVPGVYIILTYSTLHTVNGNGLRGLLCLFGCIILTLCTDRYFDSRPGHRYNDPQGGHTMCTWNVHYTDSEYTTHKDSVTLGGCIVCVPRICIMRTRVNNTQIDIIDP